MWWHRNWQRTTAGAKMGGVTSGRLLSGVLLTALLLTGAGSVSYAQGIVIGGQENKASGAYSFVGGGYHNEASGKESSVSGGGFNKASNNYSSVSGGEWNTASGEGSSVSGGGSNTASGDNSSVSGGNRNESSGGYSSVLGGFRNKASGANSSILGGWDNLASGDASSISGGWNNLASGEWSSILGGHENTASGRASSVSGGNLNESRGGYSSILGGRENKTSGNYSSVSGGYWNTATGEQSSVSGGKGNTASGENSSVSGGHHNKAIGDYSSVSGGNSSMALGEESWAAGGAMAYGTRSNAIGNGAVNTYKGNEDTAEKSIAIGYQATADTAGTISFGHDAGDASGYQVKWHKRTDGQRNQDYTDNDYTQAPESITETHYDSARYNRLVKVADGVDDHDAVVVEQLKTLAAASDASNIGTNLTKVPVTDAHGNIQYEESGAMKLRDATDEEKTANAESWGAAIGTGEVKSGDKKLVTGDTVYNELRPTADGSYIKKDSTTAQNLKNLDTQVKKTADLINSDGKTIKIGGSDSATKIDVSDKDGNGRTITGVVTDGSDNSSAANVGYVNEVAAANTQQIYRDMHSAYGHLNNNINKAAAGSNALAALHPLDYDPADKASYAVGYGHYRNANAAAVGAFYQPNANTMVSVGVSMGNGDPGVNAGVSFKVGKGSAYNGVSKAQMAETIAAQEKQISEIKASDVAKDQRIDSLEKENQEMKKQIQEILAKLGK